MSTTSTGKHAEDAVAHELIRQGYVVVDQNWKTKWCEIDVIAKKADTVFFVEVKYRANANQGDGFAYITERKLQQMAFAAELWVTHHNWQGGYELLGASVTGAAYTIIELIEL